LNDNTHDGDESDDAIDGGNECPVDNQDMEETDTHSNTVNLRLLEQVVSSQIHTLLIFIIVNAKKILFQF
jgi:hypothetical protein